MRICDECNEPMATSYTIKVQDLGTKEYWYFCKDCYPLVESFIVSEITGDEI